VLGGWGWGGGGGGGGVTDYGLAGIRTHIMTLIWFATHGVVAWSCAAATAAKSDQDASTHSHNTTIQEA